MPLGKYLRRIDGIHRAPSPNTPIAGDWGMGARVGFNIDNARPFTGMMDDLSIWKRGLTGAEVNTIMDAGAIPEGAAVDAGGKAATAWAALKR